MPNTEEQRLDVIANCDVLLNGILKPFAQTDNTAEGRMIAQLKWLKEHAERRNLALPVDPLMLSTLRYVFVEGELCRHASSPEQAFAEIEIYLSKLMSLTKGGKLLLKPAYYSYAIRRVNEVIVLLRFAKRPLAPHEVAFTSELETLKMRLRNGSAEPPLGGHLPYPGFRRTNTSIRDLPNGKNLFFEVDSLLFNGVRPDTWLTVADADCETAHLQAAYLYVHNCDLAHDTEQLAKNIAEQLQQRAAVLPSDLTQALTINLGEQPAKDTQLHALAQQIVAHAHGLIDVAMISFLRGESNDSMQVAGVRGGQSVYRLGPVNDVLAFFTCLEYFAKDAQSSEQFLTIKDRLYRRYLKQDELEVALRSIQQVQATLAKVSTKAVAWASVGIDARATQLNLQQPTVADVFAGYFESLKQAIQSAESFAEEHERYQPLQIVRFGPPALPVLNAATLQHFDDLNGTPIWARALV